MFFLYICMYSVCLLYSLYIYSIYIYIHVCVSEWVIVTQSCPTLCNPWTAVHQAPLYMEYSRQEYWSGLPFPSLGDLPDPGIQHGSPALRQILYPLSHQGSPYACIHTYKEKYFLIKCIFNICKYTCTSTYFPQFFNMFTTVEINSLTWVSDPY